MAMAMVVVTRRQQHHQFYYIAITIVCRFFMADCIVNEENVCACSFVCLFIFFVEFLMRWICTGTRKNGKTIASTNSCDLIAKFPIQRNFLRQTERKGELRSVCEWMCTYTETFIQDENLFFRFGSHSIASTSNRQCCNLCVCIWQIMKKKRTNKQTENIMRETFSLSPSLWTVFKFEFVRVCNVHDLPGIVILLRRSLWFFIHTCSGVCLCVCVPIFKCIQLCF